jgi:hydrogenase-4 membrane subunit HyfE
MGVGVRLYFLNLLYHILIFALGFFLYSLYSIITNSNASRIIIGYIEETVVKSSPTAEIGLGNKLEKN